MSRSTYYFTLGGDVKARYEQKIKVIGDIDPYSLLPHELSFPIRDLPKVTTIDLVDYLILTHSFYTKQQLKAHKSLQAFKNFEAGAILHITAKKMTDAAFVILSKVRHSQKTREKALDVWIILLDDGSISTAHCTCMAGLGEVCTHVATVLFCLLAHPETIDEDQPCTSQLSVWPVPGMRNIEMKRVHDMEFKDTKHKGKSRPLSQIAVSAMEINEMQQILKMLQQAGTSPAICRVVEPFSSEMERSQPENLPRSLDSWFNAAFSNKSYEELLLESKQIEMDVTEEELAAIEENTREQSQSTLWFKFRTGRITASLFKSVCRTSISKPSLSVIKSICYPQKVLFQSKATSYGLKYEKAAIQNYKESIISQHQNFSLVACGLIISNKHTELGASPDGLISCDCCGLGCLEVKCPYILKNEELTLYDFAQKKNSCLINLNGQLHLDVNHCYYYQVQLQMFVTNRQYCDFVLWSSNSLLIERILFNHSFCSENIAKSIEFHNYVIKPELLSRYFTEKGGVAKLHLWCSCQKPDDGRPMIKCDNDDCVTQWYHLECVGICQIPDKYWYCINCIQQ